MPSVAIVGAGCSGLSAAHDLLAAGHTVMLYEKSQFAGGRAATQQQAGFIYDYGAQYIKQGSPLSSSLITERFATDELLDILLPVWTFDGQGKIQAGDATQNAEPKWNYRHGINTLPQKMAEGLQLQYQTQIGSLAQSMTGWQIFDTAGQILNTYDAVLLTIPAPQSITIIEKSPFSDTLRQHIVTYLAQASYNPLISVELGYQPAPQPRPYYALVNTDKQHPISWLAWEHTKAPDRALPNTGLLIAQMSPQYSHDHWQHKEIGNALVIRDVAQLVRTLLNEDLPTPFFTDIHYWRYALPATKADAQQLNALSLPHSLAFCGDAFTGGRVHLALEHGREVAQQLTDYLAANPSPDFKK